MSERGAFVTDEHEQAVYYKQHTCDMLDIWTCVLDCQEYYRKFPQEKRRPPLPWEPIESLIVRLLLFNLYQSVSLGWPQPGYVKLEYMVTQGIEQEVQDFAKTVEWHIVQVGKEINRRGVVLSEEQTRMLKDCREMQKLRRAVVAKHNGMADTEQGDV